MLARNLAARPMAKAPSRARKWWTVHQWVGLKLSLFLTFILLTGTLAVVSHEIDWLLQPSLRVSPATVKGPVAWERIATNASRHPLAAEVTSIEAPAASAFAARVSIKQPDGTRAFLNAHPTTGVIQGVSPWVGAERVLRNMHRHLNLPVKYGVPIVSSLAFLLLITLVSSFFVYKKWWRGFLKPLRRRDARTWWGDLHRLAGVWSLWFVMLITVTSFWYLAESLGLDAPSAPDAEAPAIANTSGGDTADLDIRKSLAAARAAYPGLHERRVGLPNAENPVLRLEGDYRAILVRHRANAVIVDHATNAVLLTADGRDLSVHQRIGEIADPLHFGTFGGYWTKVPWFLFGLMMTALSVSGAAIYSLRIAREKDRTIRIARAMNGMWRGMGRWRWLSVALLLIGFGLLPSLLYQ